jgi:hypothetical protein
LGNTTSVELAKPLVGMAQPFWLSELARLYFMGLYKIAHIRKQGIDLIIVPLDSSFGNKSEADQHEIISGLQACASSAGLAGAVVPIWRDGNGHRFIAPPNWHPFFKTFSWNDVMRNINKELTCG